MTQMTSFERVRRAIRFQSPDRLPFTGSMSQTDFFGDVVALFPKFGGSNWWRAEGGFDEWGCLWETPEGGGNMGQVVNIVLPDIRDSDKLPIPDAGDPGRYAHWPQILDRAEREGKYVVLCNGPYLFERAHFLHGFEATLMDIASEPQLMDVLLRRLAQYHLDTIAYIRKHFPGRVHGYRGTDDWGTQLGPMVSNGMFNGVFKPVYRDIYGAAREAGMDVWMHCCGQVLPLLPEMIDAGLQVVNFMQPAIFPVPALAAFRGKICFEIAGDEQTVLTTGDAEAIRRHVLDIINACIAPDGGFIEMRVSEMVVQDGHVPGFVPDLCHRLYRENDPYLQKNLVTHQ